MADVPPLLEPKRQRLLAARFVSSDGDQQLFDFATGPTAFAYRERLHTHPGRGISHSPKAQYAARLGDLRDRISVIWSDLLRMMERGAADLDTLAQQLQKALARVEAIQHEMAVSQGIVNQDLHVENRRLHAVRRSVAESRIEWCRYRRDLEVADVIAVVEYYGLDALLVCQQARPGGAVVAVTTQAPTDMNRWWSSASLSERVRANCWIELLDVPGCNPRSHCGRYQTDPPLEKRALLDEGAAQLHLDSRMLGDRLRQLTVNARNECAALHRAQRKLRLLREQQRSSFRYFPILRRDKLYRLLNFLGGGSFAEAWEALNLESLAVEAIKLTGLDLRNSSHSEQEFVLDATCREVQLQRSLRHPNIVEMLECFDVHACLFASVLELCDGGSLDRYIYSRGPVPLSIAIPWLKQILGALSYIHEHGDAVHFDIKPSNILLQQNRIKIADFGLNHKLGINKTAVMNMADPMSTRIGSLPYLPPQHLLAIMLGATSRFDGRLDVWSSGVVFYEMLFRELPFTTAKKPDPQGSPTKAIAHALYSDIQAKTASLLQGCSVYIPKPLKVTSFAALLSCFPQAFIKQLLQVDDRCRPQASEALELLEQTLRSLAQCE